MEKLEALALSQRPEMAEEGYRARISADEARKAMVGILPNVSLNVMSNYDSNRFLVNNNWYSVGLNVALNLTKVFSIPAMNRSEEAQKRADDARRQAMAMAVLAQTRIAAVRYTLVADEFLVWDEAARDDDLIVQHLASSESAGIDNELEVVRARARAMASHINRDLAYANVQAVIARLYNSVGYDAVPREDEERPLAELSNAVQVRYAELSAPASRRAWSSRSRWSRSGRFRACGRASPRWWARVRTACSPTDARNRPATAPTCCWICACRWIAYRKAGAPCASLVGARRTGALVAPALREFRTTLSEPVDDEQWRTLGEGAAYRVTADLANTRITRPALRIEPELGMQKAVPAATLAAPAEPLDLRLEQRIAPR